MPFKTWSPSAFTAFIVMVYKNKISLKFLFPTSIISITAYVLTNLSINKHPISLNCVDKGAAYCTRCSFLINKIVNLFKKLF